MDCKPPVVYLPRRLIQPGAVFRMTRMTGAATEPVLRGEFEATVTAIHSDVSEIRDGQKWNNRLAVTTLIALVAWMGAQIWTNIQSISVRPAAAYAAEHGVKK